MKAPGFTVEQIYVRCTQNDGALGPSALRKPRQLEALEKAML